MDLRAPQVIICGMERNMRRACPQLLLLPLRFSAFNCQVSGCELASASSAADGAVALGSSSSGSTPASA